MQFQSHITAIVEEFRPIENHPNYSVSDHGRVISRLNGSIKVLAINETQNGHKFTSLGRDARGSYVHSLVLEAFGSKRPAGQVCRHLDGNPENNVPDNLAWGTHKQNAQDRWLHGTMSTKITRDDVIKIRSSNIEPKVLAKQYRVNAQTIRNILNIAV